MFRTDYDFEEALTGSDLLTEIGLDPRVDPGHHRRRPRQALSRPGHGAAASPDCRLHHGNASRTHDPRDAAGGDPLTVTAAPAAEME